MGTPRKATSSGCQCRLSCDSGSAHRPHRTPSRLAALNLLVVPCLAASVVGLLDRTRLPEPAACEPLPPGHPTEDNPMPPPRAARESEGVTVATGPCDQDTEQRGPMPWLCVVFLRPRRDATTSQHGCNPGPPAAPAPSWQGQVGGMLRKEGAVLLAWPRPVGSPSTSPYETSCHTVPPHIPLGARKLGSNPGVDLALQHLEGVVRRNPLALPHQGGQALGALHPVAHHVLRARVVGQVRVA